jgi:DNA-binding LacI/PurR family transcriptional regulator
MAPSAMNAAIEHLRELGHTRIGFISSGLPRLLGGAYDIGTAREALFCRIMQSHDIPVPDGYITHETMAVSGAAVDAEGNTNSALRATRELLTHLTCCPAAICCWRDETAMVAIQACAEVGLRVPDDIFIVGFSDLSASRFSVRRFRQCNRPGMRWGILLCASSLSA